ncbi:CRP-like cAMP-binding protein [Kordia periserrulae]|uniref:CRP-like cAMP-binding protein n=1 Tax=Kordia periserrulae TaxID=701523 RepID=A0A2T6BUN5_9FLAO|nr:Crp/Fnr family transcriptional regulator [Kordia periserrulae]PTX59756.1 CRP-like cAMP-binding protein [Kordia periserrulae]
MDPNLFPYTTYKFNNEELLSHLPENVLAIINARRKKLAFKAGEFIFEEGNLPEGIYRVKKGKVKKLTTTNFGTQHIFYLCKEREYLGYHALLSEELYADAAMALVDCELEFIPKEDFLAAIEVSHELSQRLLRSLSHEFGVFINATKLLAKHTVRERAALNLLILESKFKEEGVEETAINMSRDDLASMVGTAKESLVRMLKDFKEEQLITTHRRNIFIKNHQGLLKISNSVAHQK